MREIFLLEAIGYIDDDLIEEARERRSRPLPWKQWLAAVACLALIASAVLNISKGGNSGSNSAGNTSSTGSPTTDAAGGEATGSTGAASGGTAAPGDNKNSGSTAGDTGDAGVAVQLPGEIRSPVLWWQGRAYACIILDGEPEDKNWWTVLGEVAGTSAEKGALDDLWLYADFTAEGTIYSSEAYPDILLAEISVNHSEETCWIQFVLQSEQMP